MIEIHPKIRILVISADKDATFNCRMLLKKIGLNNIEIQESGIEALKECQKQPFDLILVDQNTRHLNGWLFIQELKNSSTLENTAIILMGNPPAPVSIENLKLYGVPPYLEFPLNGKSTMEHISIALNEFNSSGTLEFKYTAAKKALIANESDVAVQKYEELHESTNRSVRSAIGLVQSYEQGNLEEKAESLAESLAVTNESTPSRLMIAIRYLLKKGDLETANSAVDTLLESTKDSPLYYTSVLELAERHDQIELGERIARLGQKSGFKYNEFSMAIARSMFSKGQIDETIATVVKAEKEFGKSLAGLNLRGICLRKQQKYAESKSCYEAALKLSPMDVKIFFNLALSEIFLGNTDSALRHLHMCLKISPNFDKAQAKIDELTELASSTKLSDI